MTPVAVDRPQLHPRAAPPAAARDPWLDNAKMVLVTLVVVGHSVGLVVALPHAAWLYDFVYLWHIPAFVLVTGYHSATFRWDRPHLGALVTGVLLPFALIEPALFWFRRSLGQPVEGPLWLVPHWAMWYLPVLFLWRLAAPLVRHPAALPVAVVASLAMGLWSGQVLCLARVVGLAPFFVLGLLLARRRSWGRLGFLDTARARWGSLAVLAGIAGVARSTDEWSRTALLYYDRGYADLGLPVLAALEQRLVLLALGLAGSLAVLALVPRRESWFRRMGSATLVVYLGHTFVVQAVASSPWPDRAVALGDLGLVATVVGALGLALLLAAPPVRRRLAWAVDPVTTWRRQRRSAAPEEELSGRGAARPRPGTGVPRAARPAPPSRDRRR